MARKVPRHALLLGVLGGTLALLAAACAGEVKTVEVTRQVPVTVIVEKEVVKEAAVQIPKIHLRCNSIFSPNEALSAPLRFLKAELEKRSGGQITVENYFAGALWKGGEEPEALGGGVGDCGTVTTAYYRTIYPVIGDGTYLPLALTDAMNADIVHVPVIGDIYRKELAATNIVPLMGAPAPQGWHFREPLPQGGVPDPITSVFKGLRVRGYALWPDVIRAFGGTAVSFPSPEIPIALAQGQMDGFVTSWDTWRNVGVMETAPYTYVFKPRLTGMAVIGMNKDKWDSFSPDVQAFIEEARDAAAKTAYYNAVAELLDILSEGGANPKVTVTYLTEEQTAIWLKGLKPFWDDFEARSPDHARWVETARGFQQTPYVPTWER